MASTVAEFDVVVIGAGIAGAGAAAELAATRKVALLERESMPGYHTTGRSAALYLESYGNETIRALTTGGRAFFPSPPTRFAEHPLLTPRGAMYIGRANQTDALTQIYEDTRKLIPNIERINANRALLLVPALKAEAVASAVLEPDAM